MLKSVALRALLAATALAAPVLGGCRFVSACAARQCCWLFLCEAEVASDFFSAGRRAGTECRRRLQASQPSPRRCVPLPLHSDVLLKARFHLQKYTV